MGVFVQHPPEIGSISGGGWRFCGYTRFYLLKWHEIEVWYVFSHSASDNRKFESQKSKFLGNFETFWSRNSEKTAKKAASKPYCKWGVSNKWNIFCCMSRMQLIRRAFESLGLSASNDVPTSIFGLILTDLGWPEGRKSAKTAEISTSLTPPENGWLFTF